MSNRKARRAEAKAFAKARRQDPQSPQVQAAAQAIQDAQQLLSRRLSMHDVALKACQIASTLKAGDGWLAGDEDKAEAIKVAEGALDVATHGLLEAYLEAFDALAELDEPASPIVTVPTLVTP